MNVNDDILISRDFTIRHALQRLCVTATGVLFVAEGRKLIASLSDGDVRRYLLGGGDIDSQVCEAANAAPKFLSSFEREHAQSYMFEKRISAIPIVADDSKEILEIVLLRSEVDVDAVRIRELKSDDLAMVLDFFDQMAGDTRAMFDRNNVNRLRVVNHLKKKEKDNQIHFAATVMHGGSECMVGYVFLWDIDKAVPWLGIAIHEDWKGHHLGRRLLRYLDEWAQPRGYGGLLLTSVPANIRAHALYERMGYEYFGVHPTGEFLYLKRYIRG